MKAKYIIGSLIIIIVIVWAGVSFKNSLTRYVSIAEAKSSNSFVQVKGERLNNGKFIVEQNLFTFTLGDTSGDRIEVVYDGPKPGNFEQAKEIVCRGKFENGKFYAKEILVKCPSKYMEERSKV